MAPSPMRVRPLRRVMSTLKVPLDGAFVDVGCGKGRILLLAARHGFRHIVGLEFAKELCVVARDNVTRYQKKTGVPCDIRVIEGDAVNYDIQDNDTVFFLNNPFGEVLVERFTENIVRSLAAKSRQVYVVYNSPRWRPVLERHGFSPLWEIDGGECIVYGNVT